MIPDGRGAKLPLGLLAIMSVDKREVEEGGGEDGGRGRQKVRRPERNSHQE